MTEQDAVVWLSRRPDVSRETLDRLKYFASLVVGENARQNLIAASTTDHIMDRHIVDSVQLLDHAPTSLSTWMDLGSGAGFPGVVIALCSPRLQVTLVESRRKRIDFLTRAIDRLDLGEQVNVAGARVETLLMRPADVISARAFAPLGKLFTLGHRFSTANTCWLLPKGRNASNELAEVKSSWQGDFRVVSSVTDPEAAIIVARNVQPEGRR